MTTEEMRMLERHILGRATVPVRPTGSTQSDGGIPTMYGNEAGKAIFAAAGNMQPGDQLILTRNGAHGAGRGFDSPFGGIIVFNSDGTTRDPQTLMDSPREHSGAGPVTD